MEETAYFSILTYFSIRSSISCFGVCVCVLVEKNIYIQKKGETDQQWREGEGDRPWKG